jgi:hypothetical protein
VSGVFELYEPGRSDPIEVLPKGKRQVKVICAWRGGKPNGTGVGASINLSDPATHAEVIDNYTGEVVDNIGYPSDPAPLLANISSPATAAVVAPQPPGVTHRAATLPGGRAASSSTRPAPEQTLPQPVLIAGTITTQAGDPAGRLQRTKLMLEIAAVGITILSGVVALVFRFLS